MKRITFLVDDKTYEALRLQAFNERRKMSDLIRDGLEAIVNAPIAKPQHGGDRHKPADKAIDASGKPVEAHRPLERPVAAQPNGNGHTSEWHGKTVPKPS